MIINKRQLIFKQKQDLINKIKKKIQEDNDKKKNINKNIKY